MHGFERRIGALIVFGDDFCAGVVEMWCGQVGGEVMGEDIKCRRVWQQDARRADAAGDHRANGNFVVGGVFGDEFVGDGDELRIGDGRRESQKSRAAHKALPVFVRMKKATMRSRHKVKSGISAQHTKIIRADVQISLLHNRAIGIAISGGLLHRRAFNGYWSEESLLYHSIPLRTCQSAGRRAILIKTHRCAIVRRISYL